MARGISRLPPEEWFIAGEPKPRAERIIDCEVCVERAGEIVRIEAAGGILVGPICKGSLPAAVCGVVESIVSRYHKERRGEFVVADVRSGRYLFLNNQAK